MDILAQETTDDIDPASSGPVSDDLLSLTLFE